jgi:DHA3 family macrolide efflux protein-like MFS transporter
MKFSEKASKKTRPERNITLFLLSQSISMFGTSLVQYAIMWSITLETQSGWMVTLFVLAGFLPTLLLSPLAGVWVDRYSRKTLILCADASIAFCTLLMALLFFMGFEGFEMLFIVTALRALGTAVQTPATLAILPQIVPQEQLTKINGIQSSLQSLNYFIAPALGGAILAWLPLESILLIDVGTAIIGIVVLAFFVKVTDHKTPQKTSEKGYFDELREALTFIRAQRVLFSLFVYLSLLYFFVAAPVFLTPLQVTRSFGPDVWRLTAVELAFSTGMLLGGVFMAKWGGFKNHVHMMIFSVFFFGIFIIALATTTIFWLYLLWMMIVGFALPLFNTSVTVLLQKRVEENMQGRIFSIYTMISSGMMPLGMLVMGPIADVWKLETILLITGIMVILQSFFMAINKKFILFGKNQS